MVLLCADVAAAQPVRVGVLFGSFDPVHRGHVAVVRHALSHPVVGPLHRLVIVPSGPNSRRIDKTTWRLSAAARWDALERSFVDEPRVLLSSLKFVLPPTTPEIAHSMFEILERLREECRDSGLGEVRFVVVVGDDTFSMVPKYHRAQELLHGNDWLVFARFSAQAIASSGDEPKFALLVPDGFKSIDATTWRGVNGSVLHVTALAPGSMEAEASSTAIDFEVGRAAARVWTHGMQGRLGSDAIVVFESVELGDLQRVRSADPHGLLPHVHLSPQTVQPWWDEGFRHHYVLDAETTHSMWRPLSSEALQSISKSATNWPLLDRLAELSGEAGGCERSFGRSAALGVWSWKR